MNDDQHLWISAAGRERGEGARLPPGGRLREQQVATVTEGFSVPQKSAPVSGEDTADLKIGRNIVVSTYTV